MKQWNPLFLLSLFVVFGLVSCGNGDDDVSFDLNNNDLGQGSEVDACLDFGDNELLLSIQSQETELPSKVSILFRVTDIDGNPVPGLSASQFTIYEQGRNDDCFNTISTSESLARISPNRQKFQTTTLLVLDLSNSVLDSSLDELKEASVGFINNVMPNDQDRSSQMAIYWFDGADGLHELIAPTSDINELTNAINAINADISNDPSTDLYGAVIEATEIATGFINNNSNGAVIDAASVVLFTDGTDQASRHTEASAINAVNAASSNISFFSIGLGSEIDQDVLADIGKTSSVVAADKEQLENTFIQISNSVADRAYSYYLFEYCSPKRDGSGNNNLVIQVTQGARQGAVQTRFSADGFRGGCE